MALPALVTKVDLFKCRSTFDFDCRAISAHGRLSTHSPSANPRRMTDMENPGSNERTSADQHAGQKRGAWREVLDEDRFVWRVGAFADRAHAVERGNAQGRGEISI